MLSISNDKLKRNLKLDFTEFLPLSLCEDIFSLLDINSICLSSQVSKRWYNLINSSDYIWKSLLFSLNGKLKKFSDGSYKAIVKDHYQFVQGKKHWISGKYSFVSSFQDLQRLRPSCKFTKEDWEDIFQTELQR